MRIRNTGTGIFIPSVSVDIPVFKEQEKLVVSEECELVTLMSVVRSSLC
jgi:hypothetical protein